MTVHVLLFAGPRATLGTHRLTMQMPPSSTVADLRLALAKSYAEFRPLLGHSRFAIDDAFVNDECILYNQVEIAWIPPVSGG